MVQVQRYMVFFSPHYYPHGGIEDIIGQTDDLDAAIDICTNCFKSKLDIMSGDFHIVDLDGFKQAKVDVYYEGEVGRKLFDELEWEDIQIGYWI